MRLRPTSFSMMLAMVLALTAAGRLLEAQPPVKVDSAEPPSAPQGTVNLDVTITGSGFASGAASQFLVTGSENPGGIVVNATTFIDSKHLRANVSVSDTAVLGFFDIKVTLSNGRTGKGIEKFTVQPKGNVCSLRPLPSQFTQIVAFEGSQRSVEFGDSIAAAPVEAAAPFGVQAVAVTYVHTSTVEVFLLDPMLPGSVGSTGPDVILTVPNPATGYTAIQHDVDGNGVSDVIAFHPTAGVFIFRGQVSGGVLSYPFPVIQLTDPAPRFGSSVAAGNLDSDSAVEIAVGAPGETAGKTAGPGKVVVVDFASLAKTFVNSPANQKGDRFGVTVSIGDATGDGDADLVVGARYVDVSGIRDTGATYVFEHGSLGLSATLPGAIRDEGLRLATLLETGDGDSALEVFATTGVGTSGARGVVFLSGSDGPQTLPIDGLDKNYDPASAGDFDLDGASDLLIVGAQNATESSTCPNIGAAHAYFDFSSVSTDYVLQPPDSQAGDNFYGWAVEALNGTNIVLLSERRRDLDGNGTKDGQVYVYSVTP